MRRMTAVLSAAVMALATAALIAQAKPNFAGKWTLDQSAMPAAPEGGQGQGMGGGRGRGGRGGFGQEMTITQDATNLTVEYTQGQNPVKATYKLDGSESHNQMMGRGGQAMDQVSKASWEGNTLVITTTTQAGETKRVLSMEGGNLKIETTSPGFQGGAPTTTTVTYKKS